MKRLFLIALMTAASTAAMAHTSSVPHVHPHDVSILPELSAMFVAALIVACGAFVVRKFGRRL
ncbi:MAG TPA: hypothetical protein VJL90_07585 [Pseudorhodoplanes sp.]|nr:hypothetical protein [Pseudorhodoplanes sp.]